MTRMEDAFRAAGIVPAAERLARLAVAAWAKWPGVNAAGARRDYLREHLKGELTFALLADTRPDVLAQEIGALLNRTAMAIARQRPQRDAGATPAGDGGQFTAETQFWPAPVAAPSTESARPQVAAGSAAPSESTNPNYSAAPAPHPSAADARHAAKLALRLRLSRLDSFVIDGRPLGDLTAAEARRWAGDRRRDARFVDLLCGNMPSDRPIRDYANDSIAEHAWQTAESEHAA